MSIQDSVLLLLLLLPLAVDIEDLIRIVARNLVALLSTGLGIPERLEIRSRYRRITARRQLHEVGKLPPKGNGIPRYLNNRAADGTTFSAV